MTEEKNCQLCGREVNYITIHHLIPKEEGGSNGPTAALCQPCHSTIHHHFSNVELAKSYNTVEKIRDHDRMTKYLKWIRKTDKEFIRNR